MAICYKKRSLIGNYIFLYNYNSIITLTHLPTVDDLMILILIYFLKNIFSGNCTNDETNIIINNK